MPLDETSHHSDSYFSKLILNIGSKISNQHGVLKTCHETLERNLYGRLRLLPSAFHIFLISDIFIKHVWRL